MMVKNAPSTEEKIKDAARKLFVEKGFGDTTTRDIAECAETNVALVNYYFRSKENLFQSVFRESFSQAFLPIASILNDDLPLEAKIYKFVDNITDLLKRAPMLPIFILSEMRGEHAPMCKAMQQAGAMEPARGFQEQLENEAAKGNIRQVDARQVEANLMALVLFPFLGTNILKMKHDMDEAAFDRFVEDRKKIVPETILAYLRSGI
ncbi:MAG: TetR/AcrR family transcriptional regulator [Saprospiraceae bacterium]